MGGRQQVYHPIRALLRPGIWSVVIELEERMGRRGRERGRENEREREIEGGGKEVGRKKEKERSKKGD